jgi:hypothetical protein
MKSSPLPPTPPLYVGAIAEARLQQLGLHGSCKLVESLMDGMAAAKACGPYHPAQYPGTRMWAETVASLRYRLAADGWEPEVICGVDLLVERKRGIAIIVVAGNNSTGSRYVPQPRYDRDEVIRRLVNGEADTLFSKGERPVWTVYFLLHLLDGDNVRAELSRPLALAPTGSVQLWAERIVLPEIGEGPDPRRSGRDHDPDIPVAPSIEVDVRRRAQ